jgi:LMBR1 domain-containing protein 1
LGPGMGNPDVVYLSENVPNPEDQEIVLQVSISTFYAGLMAWLGWWLFAIFGGIGLAALPLDLILAYVRRPKHMNAEEFAEAQLSLRERVNELVDIGELIKIEREEKAAAGIVSTGFGAFSFDADKRKASRDEKQAVLGFKQAVFLLEKDVEDFQAVSSNYDNYNPLIPYISLVLGICSVIISVFWFIHIIVYVYPDPPLAPFLNSYFDWFDGWFPLFGTLSVALFTVYLLFCAVKGCFKFGIRFLFFHIHPMKPSKTYMSSFMFNIALVLLCALPVVQFCQDAFADYAANAEIRQIFGVQIQYLQFFTYFWTNNIFVYVFMAFTIMTSIYLACRPSDVAANGQSLRDRLKSRSS